MPPNSQAEESRLVPKLRKYSQGPLKRDEFRSDAVEALPFRALTMTRVMYNYRFTTERVGRDVFQAKLSSLNTFSVFLPAESWWHVRAREGLLDHEQGHFDIAEIAARRLELAFRKSLSDERRPIRGEGATLQAAKRALETKLKKVFEVANQQATEENRLYDSQTLHGMRHGSQAEQRRIHQLTLRRLKNQLVKTAKAAVVAKPGK